MYSFTAPIMHADFRVQIVPLRWSQKSPTMSHRPNAYYIHIPPLLICCCISAHTASLQWDGCISRGQMMALFSLYQACWMPPPRAPTAWCSWPHFNDLNHLRSTATHFRGLTEFILVDRDQCPQPWTLPDYSRGRDLSDWHDWIQLSALILLLIPPLWLWPWGQMSGMER